MKPVVTAGIVLGVLVGILTFVSGVTGWYKDPGMAAVFPIGATLILIGVLVWGLLQTAKQGRRYGGQVGAGLLICVIGGLIIIVCSFLFTSVFYPDAMEAAAEMQADSWADAGMTEAEVSDLLEKTAFTRTSAFQAIVGFIMTMLTGLIFSLILAAFIRSK